MQMSLPENPLSSKGMQAIIQHKSKQIAFDLSQYPNGTFRNKGSLTHHINAYWAGLSDYTQDCIFNAYVEINRVFESANDVSSSEYNINMLIVELQQKCKDLLDLHDYNAIQQWCLLRRDIIVPAKLPKVFDAKENWMATDAKTYTQSHYLNLCALAIVLRTMIPVWGMFLMQCWRELGSAYKDFYAYILIEKSSIVECDAMLKLNSYIENNLPDNTPMAAALIAQASSSDYLRLIQANVVVRRVCVGDIQDDDQDTNLITIIFNSVGQKSSTANGSLFSTDVRAKIFSDNDGNEGMSRMEQVRASMEIGIGQVAIMNWYCSDPCRVLAHIDPTVPGELLTMFLNSNEPLYNSGVRIAECQIKVTQYVCHKAISARSLFYLKKDLLIGMMSVAQAVLWHWGFKQLACLVGASAPNAGAVTASGQVTRYRIPPDLLEKLDAIYPYGRYAGAKKRTGVKDAVKTNHAVADIDYVATGMSANDWLINLPKSHWAEITGQAHSRRIDCPADIKIMLANLAIKIHDNL